MYGAQRLFDDLRELGYQVELVQASDDNNFVIIKQYEVQIGRFIGRIIDLAIMATADYPKSVASAIHVRANPQLFETTDTVPNVRNITASTLGTEWRYWSKNLLWDSERSTRRLISQINEIFKNA